MTVSRTICVGFLTVIVVGTLLLMLPIATASGEWNSPIVALFTATSAVCVTGLIVVDTGSYFSPLGQGIILALIQLGGLGYMTASALYRMAKRPFLVGGAAMWWGYVKSAFDGVERYDDPKLREFVREYHRNCLLKGKARATEELNRRQAAIWNPTL